MCPPEGVSVILRIEGKDKTIFEGPVTTTYHRVTTLSGKTRHCNGLNNDNNPCPGPTCTTALDDASKIFGFNFDGTYNDDFDDFFITMIADEKPGQDEFWSLCLNFHPTPVGGCQQIVKQGDEVLFAYAHTFSNNNATKNYLRLYGPTDAVAAGDVTLTVTDGKGAPIKGATINQNMVETDEYGKVTINFTSDTYKLKAHKDDNLVSIRSNELVLVVK